MRKTLRLLLASQDGYLYLYGMNFNEGGDCNLIRQFQLTNNRVINPDEEEEDDESRRAAGHADDGGEDPLQFEEPGAAAAGSGAAAAAQPTREIESVSMEEQAAHMIQMWDNQFN